MGNPFEVVRKFEMEVGVYTGAPYVVAVNSCSMALFLVLQWFKMKGGLPAAIEIPKRTYVSVPMAIIHAGSRPTFRDEQWRGVYQLKPLPVWDAARRFTSGMYDAPVHGVGFGHFLCTSHHWNKILGVQQGGCILHDDPAADRWLRRARFDGRTEGIKPRDEIFDQIGWHCYLSPEVAAEALVRLSFLPKENQDMPPDDYPDLSRAPVFRFGT